LCGLVVIGLIGPFIFSALNENVKGLAFQAAFLKATNSVFKAAILCALRSK